MSIEPDVAPTESPSVPLVSHHQQDPQPNAQPTSGYMASLYAMWDVDTTDVLERILKVLNIFSTDAFLVNGDLTNHYEPGAIFNGKQADLWGPIWIYFTLVFAVFFSSTMASLFNSIGGEYDVNMLTGNAVTLFAFTFAVPGLLWLAVQYLDLVPTLTLVQTVCLYGYSCIAWVPAVVIAGSPLGADAIVGRLTAILVRVFLVAIAFLVSAKFVYMNLHRVMSAHESPNVMVNTWRGVVLMAGLVLHAALGFTVYFLIYQASKDLKDISMPSPGQPGPPPVEPSGV